MDLTNMPKDAKLTVCKRYPKAIAYKPIKGDINE